MISKHDVVHLRNSSLSWQPSTSACTLHKHVGNIQCHVNYKPVILIFISMCRQWNLSIMDTLGTAENVLNGEGSFVHYVSSWAPRLCPD